MKKLFVHTIFHDAALLAVVCAAAIATIFAAPRPQRITKSVGSYTFANTGNAFSLYADGNHKYVLFTPENTGGSTHTSGPTTVLLRPAAAGLSVMAEITQLLKTYIYPTRPWHTRIGNVTATLDKRTITFSTAPQSDPSDILTIHYGRDDMVILNLTNLVTETPQSLVDALEETTGYRLVRTPADIRTIDIPTSQIHIINPDIAGAIRVSIPAGAEVTVRKDERSITIDNAVTIQTEVIDVSKTI